MKRTEVRVYYFNDADGGVVETCVFADGWTLLDYYVSIMNEEEIQCELENGAKLMKYLSWREAAEMFPEAFESYNRQFPGAFRS